MCAEIYIKIMEIIIIHPPGFSSSLVHDKIFAKNALLNIERGTIVIAIFAPGFL